MITNVEQETARINTYLWYSYLPPEKIPAWLDECITPGNKGDAYSPVEAAKVFDRVFDQVLKKNTHGKHLIPLSGGFDSRAILGALLERLDSSQIETVTFGAPGQLDYEIGQKVAKSAGVKCHALDLRTVELTWERIVASVKKASWTYVPDHFFNHYTLKQISSENDMIFSGFMGDPLTGGHFSKATAKAQVITEFVNRQRRVKSIHLIPNSYNPENAIQDMPHNSCIPYSVLLDLGIRQANCVAPIVTPMKCWDRWDLDAKMGRLSTTTAAVTTPFAHPVWAGYWIPAPGESLQNQNLYLEMLKMKFPELFSLPSKRSLGLSDDAKLHFHLRRVCHGAIRRVQRKAPWLGLRSIIGLNYVDYDDMFRKRKDYQETLTTALDYLKNNDITPWLDLDKLWKKHMKQHKDYGDVFCVLIGLAANLEHERLYSLQ
jgi:hypothetical protein